MCRKHGGRYVGAGRPVFRCVDCGTESKLHLCDRCLDYARSYVREHNKCSAAMVPMDYGMLQHKERYQANIKIAEERRL